MITTTLRCEIAAVIKEMAICILHSRQFLVGNAMQSFREKRRMCSVVFCFGLPSLSLSLSLSISPSLCLSLLSLPLPRSLIRRIDSVTSLVSLFVADFLCPRSGRPCFSAQKKNQRRSPDSSGLAFARALTQPTTNYPSGRRPQ